MTLSKRHLRRARRGARAATRAIALAFAAQLGCSALAMAQRPLTLDSVMTTAANQHPLLDAARARVAAARGTRSSAATLPNPVFTYWTESAPFPFQASPTGLQLETQTYATMPLEFLYQRRVGVRAADAGIEAALADALRARHTVALDAARAFYRVAEAQVVADATRDVRDRLDELVTYNTIRVREGKTAEADLIRAQVELDRVEVSVTLNQIELTRAHAALAPYLGADASLADSVRVALDDMAASAAASPPMPLPSLVTLQATARSMRPDILAARARLAAAGADAGVQRAMTIRSVGATFGSKRTAGVTSMIAGLSFPLPLFDRNRGGVQQATAMERVAAAELAWTERRVTADVQAAFSAARSLAAQVTRLGPAMLARAEESRRIALGAYQEGAVSLLQVLDASRALAEARQSWYRLVFAERESRLTLRAALGDPTLGAPTTAGEDHPRDASHSPKNAHQTRPAGEPR